MRAISPVHEAWLPPPGLEHRSALPLHFPPRKYRTPGHFDIHRVGFFTGSPVPPSWPSWHWSHHSLSTHCMAITSRMQFNVHGVAHNGCLWRKYLPAITCSLCNFATNSMCTFALINSRRTSSGSRRAAGNACNGLYGVQKRDWELDSDASPLRSIYISQIDSMRHLGI